MSGSWVGATVAGDSCPVGVGMLVGANDGLEVGLLVVGLLVGVAVVGLLVGVADVGALDGPTEIIAVVVVVVGAFHRQGEGNWEIKEYI